MKKGMLQRMAGIGLFHGVLYLFVVPFVIFPEFGMAGTTIAVVVSVIISILVLGTSIFDRNKKGE